MRVASRGLVALALGVILLAGAASPALASDAPRDDAAPSHQAYPAQTEPESTLTLTQEFGLIPTRPGEVAVTVSYDVPDPTMSLRTQVPREARVTSVQGFERGPNREYHWDESTRQPTLTYRLPVNESLADDSPEGAPGSLVAADTGSWAMFQRPATNTRFEHAAPVKFEQHRTTNGPGAAGEWLVFLGEHDLYERTANGQTFRLVVPDNANTTSSPGTILDSLATASGSLHVGDRDDEVFVVAAPTDGVSWGVRGATVGDADLWVRDVEPVDSPENPWLHEYVHSRQQFALDPEMAWFHEASASYYAALLTFEQGHVEYGAFERRLAAGADPAYDDVVLANRSTWEGYPDYDRGALVAARTDRDIRLASDGNATLQSVVREMNSPSTETSAAEFRNLVAAYGNESVAASSDRYATTPANVSTWNASAHAAAYGPFPPDVSYRFPGVDNSSSYLVTGPYRTSVVTQGDPIVLVPDEQLYVDVAVTNAGETPGEYNATLLVNGTVADWERGTVADNETTTARVAHTFERPGRHELVVGNDSLAVFVTRPADVQLGPFRPNSHVVEQGETVRFTGSATNDAAIPANGTVTVTRDGEPVATERITLGPGAIRTVYTNVRLTTPGERVVRFNGGHDVTVEVEPSEDRTPGSATETPPPRMTTLASTATIAPDHRRTNPTSTKRDGDGPVPATSTDDAGVGAATLTLAALVALALAARARR